MDEGGHVGGVLVFFYILVPSLSRVAKEGGISHVVRFLPMLISEIPLKVKDEACFKDPVDGGFFTWSREVFGKPERCSMILLHKHSNRLVARQRYDDTLRAGWLNVTSERGFSVLLGAGRGLEDFHYLIDPIQSCIYVHFLFADPVAHQRSVVGGGWVPRNAVNDKLLVLLVDWVEAYLQRG